MRGIQDDSGLLEYAQHVMIIFFAYFPNPKKRVGLHTTHFSAMTIFDKKQKSVVNFLSSFCRDCCSMLKMYTQNVILWNCKCVIARFSKGGK